MFIQRDFKKWAANSFVPYIRKYLSLKDLAKKVVLLLEMHQHIQARTVLTSDNGILFVIYLPPIVTALIQPMDQEMFAARKRHHRGHLQKYTE
jgi:hypothetical protein